MAFLVQEIVKLGGEKILKLICYGAGPRGNMPGRFETIDVSRVKLKTNGLNNTAYRIAKTCFIEEDKSKYFIYVKKLISKLLKRQQTMHLLP